MIRGPKNKLLQFFMAHCLPITHNASFQGQMCPCQVNLSIPVTDDVWEKNPKIKMWSSCVDRDAGKHKHVTFRSLVCLWLFHILPPTIPQEHPRSLLIKTEMPNQWHFATFSLLRFWNANVEKQTGTSSLRKAAFECCSFLSSLFPSPLTEQKRFPSFEHISHKTSQINNFTNCFFVFKGSYIPPLLNRGQFM